MTANLTDLEAKVFARCKVSNDGNGGDFGCVEDVVADLRGSLKATAVGAIITNLSKKGLLNVADKVKTCSGVWTQFTINEGN